jgi:translation initiation factor IF-3
MSLVIGAHDFETKVNHAIRMLKEGDKIKVSVTFRNRELSRTAVGKSCWRDLPRPVQDIAVVERKPKMEGRNMSMFLALK